LRNDELKGVVEIRVRGELKESVLERK